MHDRDHNAPDSPTAAAPGNDAASPGKRTRAESATIYRDGDGGSIDPGRGAAVDRALGTSGQGTAHESGATLHTDSVAADAASAIGARAFTAGQDVYFGAGHGPDTDGGQLLGHELTHVEQSRGVSPPGPGNFAISDPSSHQEVEARGGGGGSAGSAGAATIFRDPDTFGQSMESLLTPAVGHEQAAGAGATMGTAVNMGEAGTDAATDPLQAFRAAVLSGSAADIEAKWKSLKSRDKHKLKDETDTILKMMQSWGPPSMKALNQIGVHFGGDPRLAQHVLWQADVADWKAQMTGHQWSQFIRSDPKQDNLDQKSLDGLNQAMKVSGSNAHAREIFSKAYPKIQTDHKVGEDDWTRLQAGHWTAERVERLFDILTTKLPAPHIRAASGGFLLVTKQKTRENAPGPWGHWEDLGYAYWDPDKNLVVLPTSSSGRDGGGIGHDMVGGQTAQSASPAGRLTHFQGSALHEIGHAVGANIRGDAWAENAGPAHWAKPPDTEVKALWDAAKNIEPGGTDKKLPEADAKNVLYEFATASTKTAPAGWTAAELDYALDTQYLNQDLYKLAQRAQLKDNAYTRPTVHGGFAYAYLTRWDNEIGKYAEAAYTAKVSMYSLSSPKEWFAEQYVQFYQTNKSGAGLHPDTFAYLRDIDTRSVANPGADPAAPAAPAAPSPGGEGGEAPTPTPAPGGGAEGRAGDRPPAGAPRPHRGMFPWSW